jgi:uncharacterized membrane protein YsdA (DUF1294 family)
MTISLGFLVVMNLAALILMGFDKLQAQNGGWRVPEVVLFAVTACFGGLGGMVGMQLFRHKTRHWYFQVGHSLSLLRQEFFSVLSSTYTM